MNHEMTYLRPENLAEAIQAFDEAQGRAIPLCGGVFDRSSLRGADLLIDLQNIQPSEAGNENQVILGPCDCLIDLQRKLRLSDDFERASVAEAGLNVRNTLSLYNFLNVADGRSPLLVALSAMKVSLRLQPGGQMLPLEVYLAQRDLDKPGFWSDMVIEMPDGFSFEAVARTPLDKPIVAVAIARQKDNKLRVAVGGTVALPQFTEFQLDSDHGKNFVSAVLANADDVWASGLYRQDVGNVLFGRVLNGIRTNTHGGAM